MKFLTFCFSLFTLVCSAQVTKYVNPFIGTGGTGHTFPGATTPFAMVQISPDTRIDGSWEGCSGYHYNDSIIYGFSHTHLSGTGCSDYGDIAFMPWFSKTDVYESLIEKKIASKFSHKNEKASAGYYSVLLDAMPVKVELTATTRTGFQRYIFNEDGYGYIVLNLQHRDKLLQGKIEKINTQIYKGIRISEAWAKKQELYFGFEVNTKPIKCDIVSSTESDYKVILKYKVVKGQQILIKTGISTVDEDAALNNLKVENPTWDFEKIKLQAQQSWEKELKKIEVFDKNETNKTIFYTAMYHCMIHPSIMNDVDGRYKGRNGKIHKAEGFNYYTVFSLWDTHRALHPLLNIIDKKRSHDFVITFLKQFEQSGRLPMWELWNNETDCMIGFHSVSVILDAYRKLVISKEELKQLWPAVKAEAMSNRFGLDKFREKGYLSVEDESESVSKTAEYSYDMWCVSEIASELNLKEDEKYFRKYKDAWCELRNTETGFLQPRKNGNWLTNFNPYEVNNNYTEANSWQYSFYAPQTFTAFQSLLDSLFKVENKIQGRTQADITGLIGQYAHGNEPSHNYIYLLNDTNRIKYLKYVYDNFYRNRPDGLIGNEDCGQMSAWYVMSVLGFYQTCPGYSLLSKGLPIFKKLMMHFENGDTLFINKNFNIPNIKKEFYTKLGSDIIDYKSYFSSPLFSNSLLKKNKITFCNDDKAITQKKEYDEGVIAYDPYSTNEFPYFAKPLAPNITFKKAYEKGLNGYKEIYDYKILEVTSRVSNEKKNLSPVYVIINDSLFEYSYNKIKIHMSTIVKAYSVFTFTYGNGTSNLSTAHFYKRPHNYTIQLNCKYNRQYTADGDDGIIDGQYGDIDWRKGGWQGYQAQDFEAIIDMKEKKQFAEISANFLQDTRSWILFPKKVEFYISNDSINFKLAETIENTISPQDYNVQTQKLKVKTQKEFSTARYIKVKAYNYGKLPEWHAGKGDDAFIFIDEIDIK
jgi:predicted alpha-1,2-mannosidase